ncbi:hypothetical protein D9M69_554830 [compost metagenome]
MVEQFLNVHQIGWIAVCHEAPPGLALFCPTQHLTDILAADDHGTVETAAFDGAQHRQQVFLGESAQGLLANEWEHILGEAAL